MELIDADRKFRLYWTAMSTQEIQKRIKSHRD